MLARIVATKRVEVARLAQKLPELRARAESAPPARDFAKALYVPSAVSLIAEVKRGSPGAGPIRPDLDPATLAASYEAAGASAISVLTDREYFMGSLDDLAAIRVSAEIPLLRKDFLISEAQVWEARGAGADAVLLIAGILDVETLRGLRVLAEDLGIAALVEAHDAEELMRTLESGASIVGINNRDLRDFTTRLDTTLALIPGVGAGVTVVSESGIRSRADVEKLSAAGVDAVLVGEALLRERDPASKARELVGVPRVPGARGGAVRGSP